MDQTPINLLEIRDLKKTFSISGGLFSSRLTLTALENINFTIRQGETLGIVGERAAASPRSAAASCSYCRRTRARCCGWGRT